MANPVLHIKDSYYFEVPKMLCPSTFQKVEEFPDVWVSLDEEYQDWHFERLYEAIAQISDRTGEYRIVNLALGISKEEIRQQWKAWQHASPENFGKPFDEFLEAEYQRHLDASPEFNAKVVSHFEQERESAQQAGKPFRDEQLLQRAKGMILDDYLHAYKPDFWQFSQWRNDYYNKTAWKEIRRQANDVAEFKRQVREGELQVNWGQKKIDAYNYHLSGKILVPQPFNARLRNLYEAHPANYWYELALSKYMVIELVVGLIVLLAFTWLARRVTTGAAPKGKLWNLLETFVVFLRDHVAEPAIGHHDAHRFVPYLWTIFFFVLGCNLMGLVPWAGSPTAAFGVTLSLAVVTFSILCVSGLGHFGFFGFFKNLLPHMDLPLAMTVLIKPMLFAIELLGLLIKHGVLGVRLLANMMAGHLVLLAILGIAFSMEAVQSMNDIQWAIAAVVSVLACAALSLLELFVAFLQAYIFTFLSALFIGAALHEH